MTTDHISQGVLPGAGIAEIRQALFRGSLTVEALCRGYLARVVQYADHRAVIRLNPDLLEQARQLDRKAAVSSVGPLCGVVVLVKDNIATQTLPTTAGSCALQSLTTRRNARIVQRLLDADALILGKANLSEFANFMSRPSSNGFSVLGGQTRNAWGEWDVGGSSSGSAVGVALNLCTVALGTETSGSLVHPAGQNGVVTLKPTLGLLSRDLILPVAAAQDTAGVMARSVRDLETVFHVLVAEDAEDAATRIVRQYDRQVTFDPDSLRGRRIGVAETDSAEIRTIIQTLEQAGATVIPLTLPASARPDMLPVLLHGIHHDLGRFLQHPDVDSPFRSLPEIVAFYHANPHCAPYGIARLEAALASLDDAGVQPVVAHNRTQTRQALDRLLEEVDAIVSINSTLSAVYAQAGYPALSLPAGHRATGEPFGATFVAGALHDQLLINLASAFEQQQTAT